MVFLQRNKTVKRDLLTLADVTPEVLVWSSEPQEQVRFPLQNPGRQEGEEDACDQGQTEPNPEVAQHAERRAGDQRKSEQEVDV